MVKSAVVAKFTFGSLQLERSIFPFIFVTGMTPFESFTKLIGPAMLHEKVFGTLTPFSKRGTRGIFWLFNIFVKANFAFISVTPISNFSLVRVK